MEMANAKPSASCRGAYQRIIMQKKVKGDYIFLQGKMEVLYAIAEALSTP